MEETQILPSVEGAAGPLGFSQGAGEAGTCRTALESLADEGTLPELVSPSLMEETCGLSSGFPIPRGLQSPI